MLSMPRKNIKQMIQEIINCLQPLENGERTGAFDFLLYNVFAVHLKKKKQLYQDINHIPYMSLKVHNSVAFSIFADVCTHPQFYNIFFTSESDPISFSYHPPILSSSHLPSPHNH